MPTPTIPTTPSPRQLVWHELERYAFVHFTINTFSDREWGYGDEDPGLFAPSGLDCHQWVTAAKAAGLSGIILTAKHHDGFCLWPTATTEHNITRSPFRNGRGDLVRECAEACAAGGIRFGIYCSPWDRNHAAYGHEAYVETFHAQWRELLSNYGPLFELWLDGANGGDGYYGGARETRAIDAKTYYRYEELTAMMRELQPDAVITGGPNADLRWCGNEHGMAGLTNWATVSVDETLDQAARDVASICGSAGGQAWRPMEADLSLRRGWFWHEREAPHSPETLFEVWLASVGRGAGMLLNLAPDRRGLIPAEDLQVLHSFDQAIASFTAVDLAQDAAVTCDDPEARAVAAVVDGDRDSHCECTKIATTFTIPLSTDDTVHRIGGVRLEEDIRLGQRVSGWVFETQVWGAWYEVARGTTIGAQRVLRLDATSGNAARLRITDAIAPPVLRRIAVYAGRGRFH